MTSFKKRLQNRELLIGTWITLAHPSIAEIACRAGFDWVAIDLEHSSITPRECEDLIRVIELCGITPLVRLTSNDKDQIKRVMDSGAAGVIVPMINSASEAAAAVSAVKYPPKGDRSIGLARAHRYGAGSGFDDYFKWQNEEAVVIVQIEHKDALSNLDAIFGVHGIDAYFIGPNDLTGSMGIPRQIHHQDYINALSEISHYAKKNNIIPGIHVVEPDLGLLEKQISEGYSFIAYSLDIRILDQGFKFIHSRNV